MLLRRSCNLLCISFGLQLSRFWPVLIYDMHERKFHWPCSGLLSYLFVLIQEINEVASWLVAYDIHEIWVSAIDKNDDNEIKWEISGETVSTSLWFPSQPVHDGNCVYLFVGFQRLFVANCEEQLNSLCKWYHPWKKNLIFIAKFLKLVFIRLTWKILFCSYFYEILTNLDILM